MYKRQGYKANLTASQIINQIHSLPERDKLTNVVMMGMGEPLDNLDEVLQALVAFIDSYSDCYRVLDGATATLRHYA